MVVGGVLRRTRIRQGRTLAEVAKAAGISIPYLSELERGRKEASSEVLAAVCEGLRITLSELVTEVGREIRVGDLDGQTPRASVISLDAFRTDRPRRGRRYRRGAARRHGGPGEVRLQLAA
jgi:transcriptional regulator with XRE-family HTH domain